jgi:hypothetical protein
VYLRLQLFYGRKVHRTKRTGSRPGSLEVDINESLSFSLTGKQLDSCHLEAALMLTTTKVAWHFIKERLLALVRDLFTFSSKVIKMFILV